jgi:fibronectin-binding autotransporter adhesin
MPDTSEVVFANTAGAILDINGNTETIGSISGGGGSGGNIYIGTNGALTVSQFTNGTYAGTISGSGGSFTKSSYGVLTLSGANTYTGATTVSSGILTVSGSLSDSTAVSVSSGATYALGASDTIGSIAGAGTVSLSSHTLTAGGDNSSTSLSGIITGTGALTKAGTGTLTLSGSNTYTGKTTINGGTITLGANNVIPDTSEVVFADTSGATLNINGKTETIGSISGGGSNGGDITLGAGALTVSQFTNGTYAGVISGSGSFTKSSYGILTLSGANTYSGATTISGGTLIVSGSLSNSTAVTVDSGATYALGASDTIGSIAGAGTVSLSSYTLTAGGDNSDTSVSGTITGTNGALTKAGTGILTLSGSNSYTGKTIISAGAIKVGANNVMPDTSEVIISSGAVLNINSKTDTIGSLSGAGNITLDDSGAGGSGALTVNQFTFGDYSGVISGAGTFTKSSYGVLRFTSANTYTGATTVSGGDLIIMINSGIPNTSLSLTGSSRLLLLKDGLSLDVGTLSGDAGAIAWLYPNSTMTINQASDAIFAGVIKSNSNGGIVKAGTGALTLSGVNIYEGTTTVNAGALNLTTNNAIASSISVVLANTSGARLNINGTTQTIGALSGGGATGGNIALGSGGGALTISQRTYGEYSGVISGTGSFTKSGPAALKLNNTNTYSGNTILSGGEIILGISNALPTTTALSFTGASTKIMMLDESINQTIASLSSTFGLSNVSIFGYGGYVNNTFTVSQSGNSTFYGDFGGDFAFVKGGAGTLTLSGNRGSASVSVTGGAVN